MLEFPNVFWPNLAFKPCYDKNMKLNNKLFTLHKYKHNSKICKSWMIWTKTENIRVLFRCQFCQLNQIVPTILFRQKESSKPHNNLIKAVHIHSISIINNWFLRKKFLQTPQSIFREIERLCGILTQRKHKFLYKISPFYRFLQFLNGK